MSAPAASGAGESWGGGDVSASGRDEEVASSTAVFVEEARTSLTHCLHRERLPGSAPGPRVCILDVIENGNHRD